MSQLRALPSDMTCCGGHIVTFDPHDEELIEQIVGMAQRYPHPHSIFGREGTRDYVLKLARDTRFSGEGWYGVGNGSDELAAAHLGVYGTGCNNGHTLFKVRHPLCDGLEGGHYLILAIERIVDAARRSRPGSQKLVIFLSENERDAIAAVTRARFALEGTLNDYYRLGERCLIFGRTEVNPS